MSLSIDDIHRLALLSRIDVTDAEVADVQAKLASVFDLIDELQAIDTRDIVPMAHTQDVALPLREDVVIEVDRHALFQEAAPAAADGLYLVPRVIE